jgi:hypothetical protein
MSLPFADQAIVSQAKLVEYLLNPDHPGGRGKAQFFLRLGFRREQPDLLRQALLHMASTAEMTETRGMFGRKFVGAGELATPSGRTVRVLTVWMLADGVPPTSTGYRVSNRLNARVCD